MDKLERSENTLIKLYLLTDEPTGLQVAALYREQLEPLEHSTSTIEAGYFISKEKLLTLLIKAKHTDKPSSEHLHELLNNLGVE
jgi:hypothetical protein